MAPSACIVIGMLERHVRKQKRLALTGDIMIKLLCGQTVVNERLNATAFSDRDSLVLRSPCPL